MQSKAMHLNFQSYVSILFEHLKRYIKILRRTYSFVDLLHSVVLKSKAVMTEGNWNSAVILNETYGKMGIEEPKIQMFRHNLAKHNAEQRSGSIKSSFKTKATYSFVILKYGHILFANFA